MVQLRDLCPADARLEPVSARVEISAITLDSRKVAPGMLFAALPGTVVDGARFIPQALAAGAAAILCTREAAAENAPSVPCLITENPRRALAEIAARFYPAQPEAIVAVTGTSGKTSVADFTRQIFAKLGHKAASVGTIGVIRPDGSVYGGLTTPDPVTLHQTLSDLAGEGVTHLAFEASSHGLDQHRLDGVRIAAAAFTNLGRDHLDYHPTLEHYLNAKLRLFREILPAGEHGCAVINLDGAEAERVLLVAKERRHEVVTVGRRGTTLQLIDAVYEGFSQRLTLKAEGRMHEVLLPLVGAYQVENALTAAGLAHVFDGLEPVLQGLSQLNGVPGRLERIGEARGGLVVVDYAHKPEALAAALASLRPFVTGRLICVFGCGGDRDKGKRPIMGQIAADGADIAIVTDDNPRSEDPAAIRSEILTACPGAREIGDRAEAIHAAVGMIATGDVVLIAGKGHETGQIVGDKVLPFSDQDVARAAIAELSA